MDSYTNFCLEDLKTVTFQDIREHTSLHLKTKSLVTVQQMWLTHNAYEEMTDITPYHSLTPWSRVRLEKPTGSQLVKKFPAFYGTRRFITAFTSARHLSLFWARSIRPLPPHPTSWRSILVLSSHLSVGLPSGLFPSGFPTKLLHTPI